MFLILILIVNGKLVPGWLHRREIERADRATEVGTQMVEAMGCQTDQIEALTNLLRGFIAGGGEVRRK